MSVNVDTLHPPKSQYYANQTVKKMKEPLYHVHFLLIIKK